MISQRNRHRTSFVNIAGRKPVLVVAPSDPCTAASDALSVGASEHALEMGKRAEARYWNTLPLSKWCVVCRLCMVIW